LLLFSGECLEPEANALQDRLISNFGIAVLQRTPVKWQPHGHQRRGVIVGLSGRIQYSAAPPGLFNRPLKAGDDTAE